MKSLLKYILFGHCLALLISTKISAQNNTLPSFSQPHGIYDNPFQLKIESQWTDAVIRYTLDGSEPTINSSIYNGEMTISSNTIIRAKSFRPNGDSSQSVTATYLFPESILAQPNNPEGYPDTWGPYCEISGTAIADYEMDPEMTQDKTLRNKIIEGLYSLPVLSIVTDKDNFFLHDIDDVHGGIYIYTGTPVGDGTGRGWERPVSFELFGGPQHHDLYVNCGVKIHGGHGRLPEKNPKHSMRLVFKPEFGPKKLDYPIYGHDHTNEYNALIIRTAFGNAWQHWDGGNRKAAQYTRDMWARSMQKKMGHPSSFGMYVHVFINGMYWGMYCLTERIDDSYCATNFGGKKSYYDIIKVEEFEGEGITVEDGDIDEWNEMLNLVKQAASSRDSYQELLGIDDEGQRKKNTSQLLDVDNFIDYMLINQYAGNTDWDQHNWYAFRNRSDGKTGFRFICWDSELIFGSVTQNVLGINHKNCPSYIFNTLMSNKAFYHKYIDRAYKHLTHGGLLTEKSVVAVWDSLYSIIASALYDESARWGDYRRDVHPYTSKGHLYTVDSDFMTERNRLLKNYFPQRADKLLAQIKEQGWWPDIEPPIFKINREDNDDIDTLIVSQDALVITGGSNIYYTTDGNDPVSWLKYNAGKRTSSAKRNRQQNILNDWTEGDGYLTVKAISSDNGQWSATAERTFYIINPGYNTGINSIVGDDSVHSSAIIYDIMGRRVADDVDNLIPGIYIKNGKKIVIK